MVKAAVKLANPRKHCSCLLESGTGQEVTADTFARSIWRLPLAMMYPRNETDGAWHSHSSALMNRDFWRRRWRQDWTCWICSSWVLENIRMLLR